MPCVCHTPEPLSLELQNKGAGQKLWGLLVPLALILLIGSLELRELIALWWVPIQIRKLAANQGMGGGENVRFSFS